MLVMLFLKKNVNIWNLVVNGGDGGFGVLGFAFYGL